jgi:hypothetical protein
MLAGLGVHYLTGLLPARWFRALVWPLAAVGIVGPVVVIARDGIGALPLTGLFVGAAASGVAIWQALRCPRVGLAFALLALATGIGTLGAMASSESAAYSRLRAFVEPLRDAARADRVYVWQAHPLLSYELGLHQRGLDIAAVLARRSGTPIWIIAGKPLPEPAGAGPVAGLVEEGRLAVKGQGLDVTLYRLEGAPGTP